MSPPPVHPPVSVVTVMRDGRFFISLLVEQVRRTVADRDYEIGAGQVSRARYLDPLVARLRAAYCLDD